MGTMGAVSASRRDASSGEGEAAGARRRCCSAHSIVLGNGWGRTVWKLKLGRSRSALDSSTHRDVGPSPRQVHVQMGNACSEEGKTKCSAPSLI